MVKKVRLTLDVSEELNRILEEVAQESGVTKSDVLRKAVAMMDVAHKAKKDGKRVGIARDNQSLETEFIGL